MGFNSAFKGLNKTLYFLYVHELNVTRTYDFDPVLMCLSIDVSQWLRLFSTFFDGW